MDTLDAVDLMDYIGDVSTPKKGAGKAKTTKKTAGEATAASLSHRSVIPAHPATAAALYQFRAPAGGKSMIKTILRETFGHPVDVEEVRDAPNRVLIRTASANDIAILQAENIEREFAARKVLLAKARPIDEVREMLSIKSRQTLHNWISQGKVIALMDNGRSFLPLWQFDAGTADKVVAGFSEVLRALKRSSFSAAHWFTKANAQLGNKTPIAVLRSGQIDQVLAEAERADVVS